MTLNIRQLKQDAADALNHAPGHRRLVLISAGAAALASLVLILIGFLLDAGIASTSGLGSLGTRAMLETANQFLSTAVSLALPFWAMGYTAAVLRLARRQEATPSTLLEGFRRWGTVLAVLFLEAAIIMAVVFIATFLGTILFSFTPLANSMLQLAQTMPADVSTLDAAAAEALMNELMVAAAPMFLFCVAVALIAVIPVSYRLRLTAWCIVDDPRCGAVAALRQSLQMTKGSCLSLFKLDLSFWWYYLAEAGVSVLLYLNILLPALGVTLPFSADTAYFLFSALGLGAQLALYYGCRNQVEATYSLAYESLKPPPPPAPSMYYMPQ